MPIFALLAGISLVTTLVGAGLQVAGAATAAAGAKVQAEESSQIERDRQKQVALETNRQRREVIRNKIQAISQARSNALILGVDSRSSGPQGGIAQIEGQAASNTQGINQAQSNANDIFARNVKIAAAGGTVAWGEGLTSMGSSISGLRFQ